MTYDFSIGRYEYIRSTESPYKSLFDEAEFTAMIRLCKRVFKKEYINGASVRLDYCVNKNGLTAIGLSHIGFYDFITSNFALFNIKKITVAADGDEKELVWRLADRYEADGAVDDIHTLLSRPYLSNLIAISCLITDRKGRILITRRNGTVGISNNFYSTTVTGSVDAADLYKSDPLKECCIREVREELSYELSEQDVVLHTISVGVKKLQPIALADVVIDDVYDVIATLKNTPGFKEENSDFYVINREDLRKFLSDKDTLFTEAGREHLERAMK